MEAPQNSVAVDIQEAPAAPSVVVRQQDREQWEVRLSAPRQTRPSYSVAQNYTSAAEVVTTLENLRQHHPGLKDETSKRDRSRLDRKAQREQHQSLPTTPRESLTGYDPVSKVVSYRVEQEPGKVWAVVIETEQSKSTGLREVREFVSASKASDEVRRLHQDFPKGANITSERDRERLDRAASKDKEGSLESQRGGRDGGGRGEVFGRRGEHSIPEKSTRQHGEIVHVGKQQEKRAGDNLTERDVGRVEREIRGVTESVRRAIELNEGRSRTTTHLQREARPDHERYSRDREDRNLERGFGR